MRCPKLWHRCGIIFEKLNFFKRSYSQQPHIFSPQKNLDFILPKRKLRLISALSDTLLSYSQTTNQCSSYSHKIKPNHRDQKFLIFLVNFQNLRIVWTEGKNRLLPDLLSRSLTTTTQDEPRLKFAETSESNDFFMTQNQQNPPTQCHYALSKEYINNSCRSDYRIIAYFIYLRTKKTILKYSWSYLPVSHTEYIPKAQQLELQNQRNT